MQPFLGYYTISILQGQGLPSVLPSRTQNLYLVNVLYVLSLFGTAYPTPSVTHLTVFIICPVLFFETKKEETTPFGFFLRGHSIACSVIQS